MIKYDNWNELKKDISRKSVFWTIKPREIYWVRIGKNIGFEQDGKGDEFLRPVLVLKKFSKDVFVGLALTSQQKENHPLYFKFSYKKGKDSYAILSQIRLYDTKRIYSKSGKIGYDDFVLLKTKLKDVLEL